MALPKRSMRNRLTTTGGRQVATDVQESNKHILFGCTEILPSRIRFRGRTKAAIDEYLQGGVKK